MLKKLLLCLLFIFSLSLPAFAANWYYVGNMSSQETVSGSDFLEIDTSNMKPEVLCKNSNGNVIAYVYPETLHRNGDLAIIVASTLDSAKKEKRETAFCFFISQKTYKALSDKRFNQQNKLIYYRVWTLEDLKKQNKNTVTKGTIMDYIYNYVISHSKNSI